MERTNEEAHCEEVLWKRWLKFLGLRQSKIATSQARPLQV